MVSGLMWVVAACHLGDTSVVSSASSTLVAVGADGLVVANVDEGSLSVVHPDRGAAWELPVGSEPTRLASHDTRVWATLRLDGEGGSAVLTTATGSPRTARTWVGSEPYGIVVSPDGERVYVAVSLDHRGARARRRDTRSDRLGYPWRTSRGGSPCIPVAPRWRSAQRTGEAGYSIEITEHGLGDRHSWWLPFQAGRRGRVTGDSRLRPRWGCPGGSRHRVRGSRRHPTGVVRLLHAGPGPARHDPPRWW